MSEINYKTRYLGVYLKEHPEDLRKMVFIAGPRQVGKTTLLEELGLQLGFKKIISLNWDRPKDRIPIRDTSYDFFNTVIANSVSRPLITFDELHKYPKWKSFLKGYYDTFHKTLATFVTGSARLNVFRRGGDSLLGRYWFYHLYPFSLSESLGIFNFEPPRNLPIKNNPGSQAMLDSLLRWGGFPEPFLARSDSMHRRWIRLRREILVREDLRDLSRIHDLSHVDNLMDLVIASIGSTLSVNSLKENLNVSYNAVQTWLKWLEAIYYCFRISPYSKRVVRGLKKEGKYFLFDWSEIQDPGARFENLVAVHLKKSVDFWNDSGMGQFNLHFVRDLEKREVDFVILKDKKVWMLIETKLDATEVPRGLRYMTEVLKPEHSVLLTQSTHDGAYSVIDGTQYWVTGATSFLQHFV